VLNQQPSPMGRLTAPGGRLANGFKSITLDSKYQAREFERVLSFQLLKRCKARAKATRNPTQMRLAACWHGAPNTCLLASANQHTEELS